MTKEDPRNIRLRCSQHKLNPNPVYADMPFDQFIGNYCKLAFPQPDGKHNEYMWVIVTGMAETEGEELRGQLDNDPVKATQFKSGDLIEFSRNEVIELLGGDN